MLKTSVLKSGWVYALVFSMALLALYATGFRNDLVFDDGRLVDGSIFGRYGGLTPLQTRLLSFGSFVWLREIFGEGWWWQRVFNALLHLVTALLLGQLVHELLKSTRWSDQLHESPQMAQSLSWASRLAAALWAFHPVAVYGVAYLVQRSIVMATLFTVLALLAWVYAIKRRSWVWLLASALAFVLALASKEYAVTAALLAPLVYIYVARPSRGRILAVTLGALGLSIAVSIGLYKAFPFIASILGEVFDETSRAFAAQLEALRPGIREDLFGLSIMNQASLFWRYGLSWFLPVPWLLSVDLRPPFPLSYLSLEMVGAIAYLLALAAALWALLSRRDTWSLAALAVLMPGLMFITEFATVWIQDPLVLYRSYLWSIGVPILLAIPLAYLVGKSRFIVAGVLALALAALSLERIDSFSDSPTLWRDASRKIDRSAPANAVGRARPFHNLGVEFFKQSDYSEAERLFNIAIDLDEPLGASRMNLGVILQQKKLHQQALENFDLAEKKGFEKAALFFHRGESQFALRQYEQAISNYSKALNLPQVPEAAFMTRVRRAEALVGQKDFEFAVREYREIVQLKPDAQRYSIGLAMALNGQREFKQALQIINTMIQSRPTPGAHYARALTLANMGDKTGAQRDLDIALSAEPRNPVYLHLQRQLSGQAPLQKQ